MVITAASKEPFFRNHLLYDQLTHKLLRRNYFWKPLLCSFLALPRAIRIQAACPMIRATLLGKPSCFEGTIFVNHSLLDDQRDHRRSLDLDLAMYARDLVFGDQCLSYTARRQDQSLRTPDHAFGAVDEQKFKCFLFFLLS